MVVRDPSQRRPTLYEMIESQGYMHLDSMEGVMDLGAPVKVVGSKWQVVPGVLLAVAVTMLAVLASELPFPPFTMEGGTIEHPLGVSILAILLGMIVGSVVKLSSKVKLGCKWAVSWFIPVAIVCLGARMDLSLLDGVGLALLGVVIGVMLLAIGLAFVVGKMFGMSGKASYLLGVGTAVCGSSAILAVAPVSESDEDDVVVAVGAVNLIGLLAMFTCAAVVWWMPEISATLYGAWSGATIHAVPQVVAAGESHSADAATLATAVKLLRVTLLAPVVVLSALYIAKRVKQSGEIKHGALGELSKPQPMHKYVPWFVWGFVIIGVLASFSLIPSLVFGEGAGQWAYSTTAGLGVASKWLLAVSMAAIGLQVSIKTMLTAGAKAMLAGLVVWIIMASAAFALLKWLV